MQVSTVDNDEVLKAIEKLVNENKTLTAQLVMMNQAVTNMTGLLIELIEPETDEYIPVPKGQDNFTMYN
jgi:hypothetical protein